jgi:pimeloyl-ACP methyl ester carboxylesterase
VTWISVDVGWEPAVTEAFRVHEWRSADGLKLFARDYGPRDYGQNGGQNGGKSSGKLPVICIPGLTRNSRDFEDVAPAIAAQGRRVLAVDLRGRGRSGRSADPKAYSPRTYADDMMALLASIGAPRAIFVGTSLGGLVTMTLAVRNPRAVAGAILNDVGPEVGKAGLARIRSYAGKGAPVQTWEDAAAYVKRTNGIAFPDHPDDAWLPFARKLFRDEGGAPVIDYDPNVARAASPIVAWLATRLLWPAFRRLAKIGPVLLVHGELSDIIEPGTIARMKLAAPHLKVTAVPRVGHAPMLTEPAAREAIAAFLGDAP